MDILSGYSVVFMGMTKALKKNARAPIKKKKKTKKTEDQFCLCLSSNGKWTVWC